MDRGRRLGRRQDSKESRDSSVSSTSREVRCGCQYFQSDSLLPERHTLVGTRPSSRNMGDHEYEVINPPASQQAPTPSPLSPPELKVTDQDSEEKITESQKITVPEKDFEPEKITEPERIEYVPKIDRYSEHQYLRIPLDKDLIIPIDKEEIESIRYDDEEETENKHPDREMTVQEIQDQMEERFFSPTPTTSISRTDGEFNTSQMDSSGLDELPLKKDARKGFIGRGFQQKIQSQAGRLRTRIRNISRPKINFPERPKIHLPDKPKFNLPERPKFNIKRPDIKMPTFNFGKTKTSSIRRPLRDRTQIPSNQSTVGSKKNIFDSINFRTYPRIFSKKKKGAQGRRALTPDPRMETESTPPSSPASRKGAFGQRWTQRFKDLKGADDDNQLDLKKPSFDDDVEENSAPFREPDLRAAVTLGESKQMTAESSVSIPGSDREQQSSGSSSERHRAGVIEEIDSDEFFLREKGLSREDVDVSRYLSLEIRDAFRSPKNALARLDGDLYDDDNEGYDFEPHQRPTREPIRLSMEAIRNQSSEQIKMSPEREIVYQVEEELEEPVRPERTRSLKKPSRSKSEEQKSETDNQFNTYPPNRPNRNRKQSIQSKQSIPQEDYNEEEKEIEQIIDTRQPSIPSLAITDTTKELSPTRFIDESSEALNEPWMDEPQPPLPPKRRKSTRDSSQDNESLSAHNYDQDRWLEDVQNEDDINALQEIADHERYLKNNLYDHPPALPMRKQRSQGTSLADEDRTSRGADSLISESQTHLTEDLDIRPENKAFISDSFDYAIVEKPSIEQKSTDIEKPKPVRPPPPSRRKKTTTQLMALKNQGINFFFTYPRRALKKTLHKQPTAPTRPLRNYSTIGPARPPRRNRVFREPVYEGEFIPLKDESEAVLSQDDQKTEFIDSDKITSVTLDTETEEKTIEKSDQDLQEMRDLQSVDVFERMKGRPLPPPPRPPRKSKDDYIDSAEYEGEEVESSDADEQDNVVVERIDIHVGHAHQESDALRRRSLSLTQEDFQLKDEIESEKQREFESQLKEEIESEKQREIEPQLFSPQEPVKEPPVKVERRKKSLSVTKTAPPRPPTPLLEASVSTQTDKLPEGCYVEEEQQTTDGSLKPVDTSNRKSQTDPEKETEVEKKVETVVEHKVVVIPTPETEILKTKKLHVAELDVDKLTVSELKAQKITVSDIDGVSMQVTELSCKSGHLVVSEFDLPSSFLEAITPPAPPAPTVQIQSSTQTPPQTIDSQTNTTPQELPSVITQPPPSSQPPMVMQAEYPPVKPLPTPTLPPKRPSPPPIVIQSPHGQSSAAYVPGSYIPASPPPRSPLRSRGHGHDSEEELRIIPRRRRHHSQKHSTAQYSSDEAEEDYPSFPIVRRSHQHDPTASELVRQLFAIWQASTMRGVNYVIEGLNAAFPEGEKRKDAQTAAIIILVLIAGLLVLGFGSDKTVHHHHWDFLPPHP